MASFRCPVKRLYHILNNVLVESEASDGNKVHVRQFSSFIVFTDIGVLWRYISPPYVFQLLPTLKTPSAYQGFFEWMCIEIANKSFCYLSAIVTHVIKNLCSVHLLVNCHLLISSEVLMIEHWYLACMILVTSPFNWHHAVTMTLTFDLLQGQSCCRAGDHNSPNLLVVF